MDVLTNLATLSLMALIAIIAGIFEDLESDVASQFADSISSTGWLSAQIF